MIVAGLILIAVLWLALWHHNRNRKRLDADFQKFLSETYVKPSQRRKRS